MCLKLSIPKADIEGILSHNATAEQVRESLDADSKVPPIDW